MSSPMDHRPTFRDRIEARVGVLRKLNKYKWFNKLVKNDLLWGVVFTILITVLMVPFEGINTQLYQLNDVVTEAIIAPEDMQIPDEFSTNQKRLERVNNVQTVYRFDDTQWQNYTGQLEQLFSIGRQMIGVEQMLLVQPLLGTPGASNDFTVTPGKLAADNEFISELQSQIESNASLRVPEEVLQALLASGFSTELESLLTTTVREIMQKPIVNTTLHPPRDNGYVLRPIENPEKAGESIVKLSRARTMMQQRTRERLGETENATTIAEWLQNLVDQTATVDEAAMQAMISEAQLIETLYFDVKRGEVIARKGDRITDQDQLTKVNYILGSRFEGVNLIYRSIAILAFTSLFLYALFKFAELRKRRRKINFQLFLMLCMILTTNILAIRIVMAFGESFASNLAQNVQVYYWAIPFAMGAMLITLLVGTQIAALYSVILVFLSGFLLNGEFNLVLFALVGTFVSIYSIRQYTERTALIKSGILLGLSNVLTIFALNLMSANVEFNQAMLMGMLMGFIGGLLTSFLVSFILPLLESFFKVITDIKLLELSNHEHPLLRKLFLNAPGTFQHSIVVGYLAEAAASGINANPLFCRVACLYHDIGKMLKPQYFVENSDDMGRKHEKLSPHMSALIISSHVKEGIELGRKYRLPESIIDIIPQHHGTKLIKYFYEKAKKNRKPDDVEVKEEEFRYPGPKPQTREAGIIMIADGVEAAARSLDDPTPGRLKGTIQAIIDNTFLDGQLDECDLTLRDLTKIQESFLKILLSMKHERIKYPGFNLDRSQKGEAADTNTEDTPASGAESEAPQSAGNSGAAG